MNNQPIYAYITYMEVLCFGIACGLDPVLLTSQSGSFSSPGYPRGYGANLGCIWQVKAVGAYSGYRIEIEFTDMDLDCSTGDQVTVYTGTSHNRCACSCVCVCVYKLVCITYSSTNLCICTTDNTKGRSWTCSVSYLMQI